MARAIGYTRVSTEGQVMDGVSLAAQEAKIRAWATANDYGELAMYTDEGVSGKRADNRPGLQEALRAARRGDVLVTYSISRLSRSTRDMLSIAEDLDRRGVDLVSMSEKIDTTSAAGKMVFRLLAVLAEFERDQVSDRTRFALAHKRQRQEKTGGGVPFGYDATADGRLVANEAEQEIIALVFELRGRGHSLAGIARELNRRGAATKEGAAWKAVQVKRVLARLGRAA